MASPKKRKRSRTSGILAFLVTFLLFLLTGGAVYLWAITEFMSPSPASSPGDEDHSSTVSFDAEDIQRLLIVTIDERTNTAEHFMVVTANPAENNIQAMALPRETTVSSGTEQYRLFELYAASGKGIQAVQSSISSLLQVSIDYYTTITFRNIEQLVDGFENKLVFEVPQPILYVDPVTSATLRLTPGRAVLTGSQVASLLRYDGWQVGRRQKAEVGAQVTSNLINQYLVSYRSERGYEDFTRIINLVNSNILVSDYYQAKSGLDHLASCNTDNAICRVIPPQGEFVGSGDAVRFEWTEQQ